MNVLEDIEVSNNPFVNIDIPLPQELINKGVQRVVRGDGTILRHGPKGTLLDDPNAPPGSLVLADSIKEEYCQRSVIESHVNPVDIFRELYPEKAEKTLFLQLHYQYKTGKTVSERLRYLKQKAAGRKTDAVDDNYIQLLALRDKLYHQAHNAAGIVSDTSMLKHYLTVVDTLNKMYGEYVHIQKHEITAVDNIKNAKEDIENMLDAKLAVYELS